MTPNIEPAVEALTTGISEVLGPPEPQTNEYIRTWRRGEFEVAVQAEIGPHVWISDRWRPRNQEFRGLEIEQYPSTRTRHSGLKKTQSLGPGHGARCIKNVGDHVSAVIRAIQACAQDAGVVMREVKGEEDR